MTRHAPIARRRGTRAEIASLRARLGAATRASDADAERSAATALARALAGRGVELDLATKLARRALMLGDDPSLREELSSWFAALGEPGLAARTLRSLAETETGVRLARLLTRIAVFLGRNGDARGAAEALLHAGAAHREDAVPEELRGAIAAWSPEAVSPSDAAEAYLEAARRREAKGESAAAFEDLLRAFEIAPFHPAAAERLAQHLGSRGRAGAADELLREHARASGAQALAIHHSRLRDAVADGDAARALGAAFDAGLDRDFEPSDIARTASSDESGTSLITFDRLLLDVGLHEIVAARLELAAEALSGGERARARIAQGRVAAGPIGSGDRAADAFIDALVSDTSSEQAKALLRQQAVGSGDHAPLVEALIRVGMSGAAGGPQDPDRIFCLRELVILADQRLSDPSLALWAVRQLLAVDQKDEELRAIATRLAPRARLQNEALAATLVQLESSRSGLRVEQLRVAAVALRGRPDEIEKYVQVLDELAREAPEERVYRQLLERALVRIGRDDALEALFRADLDKALPKAQHERARLALSWLRRKQRDVDGAITVLEPLLDDGAVYRAGWAMLFALATIANRPSLRAEALRRSATLLDAPLVALLASVAAEIHLSVSEMAGARRAAEQACHADSSSPRSIAALARATEGQRDRVAAVALERIAGIVLPRAAQCRALAETHEALGDSANALVWTQRWLALRPGDREATKALVERVLVEGDPGRVADALGWILSQPQPLAGIVPYLSRAIRWLSEVDAERAAALSRRALDVFGPRIAELSDVVLEVADKLGDRGLGIAVIERNLASGAPGKNRAELLVDLAKRRRHAGDADGALATLVRALAEGAEPALVLAELDVALPPKSSDGELAVLSGRAEALSALSLAELEGTAKTWREYGAALWDLADDQHGAIFAWERAALLDGEVGIERFARDLVAFSSHAEAVRCLEDLATRRRNRSDVARALAAAAAVALDGGLRAEALGIAIRALEADWSRADVLGIAERSAAENDGEALERAYDIVARGSMGIYGERATHYRAARQFEKRGLRERALRHAILAFQAVPAEGVTFVLMMRLAERVGDSMEAVHAIEAVATLAKGVEERAAWLRRAALVAGFGEEGKRQRVDVLLRALEANPHAETLRSLGVAMTELVRSAPDEREVAEMRFSRALAAMLPRLEGPDGARVAVFAAETALGTFESVDLAADAIERAAAADASIDEYRALVPSAAVLGASGARTTELLAALTQTVRSPHVVLGPALVELAEAVADVGDVAARATLLVAIALREPENRRVIDRAEAAARAAGDAVLLDAVLAAVPVDERIRMLLGAADLAAAEGDTERALASVEEARAVERISPEQKSQIETRLVSLYRRAGRFEPLETLLRERLAIDDIDLRIVAARDLAALLFELERAPEGFDVLEGAILLRPPGRDVLLDVWNHARSLEDTWRQVAALSRLVELEEDPQKRLVLLRRLAPLALADGDEASAFARYKEILAIDERDVGALSALERDAENRGDWDTVAELLSRRAAAEFGVDPRRLLGLRRAEVLESKLGRPDDARVVLEALLGETGDSLSALVALADLNERASAKLHAAPLWLRAAALSNDRVDAAEFSRRACQAYLDGGDAPSARRVFLDMGEYPRTPDLVTLRVEIERRGENPRALSEALEEMALSSMDPPKARAGLLVEAARAALAAGDTRMALGQAQRAARIANDSSGPQLFARWLEYRERGPGSREEASTSVSELRSLRDPLDARDRDLHAFLLAEALDVANGEGEGLRELARVQVEFGPVPLVSIGMAERLARGQEPDRALPFFDAALDGDTRELRRRGQIALAAARAAERAGRPDRALEYLEIAASAPDTRPEALGEQIRIRGALGRLSEAPPLLETTADLPSALESAEPPETPRDAPVPTPREFAVRGDPVVIAEAPDPAIEPAEEPEEATGTTLSPEPHLVRAVTPRGFRVPAFAAASANEDALLSALSRGSIEAGKELVQELENRPDRTHDLVNACRHIAHFLPGDRWVLEKLYEATLADRNIVYARAVEHVLRAFDPKAALLAPPPLAEQIEQPDRVHAVLFRDTSCPATEALRLLWSGAQHLFRRDPSSYGVTGLERVSPGGPTPLSRLFGSAARLLGLTRTPLFQRRSADPVKLSVALLSPPALVLTGDAKSETPALGYQIGTMLAATLPEHVLLFGAPEAQVKNVLRALVAAFGPPSSERGGLASIATLAEMLWESIPARSQRRLRELCNEPSRIDYDLALSSAQQAVRRAGLFVSGDLTVAIREACADLGVSTRALDAPGGLEALCSSSPAVADLVRLATSLEFASTRWQQVRGGGRHTSGTWSTV
ncbi:MAG TPA: hypothetical protein VH142_18085 [Polyangiaceae bacterium]|nr:hypothetical protein [Polyangiaceae bacterium]